MSEQEPIVTMRELAARLDRIEARLTPEEKPDMNKILRAEIDSQRNRTTITRDVEGVFPLKKGK